MKKICVLFYFLFFSFLLTAQTDLSGIINDYTVVTNILGDECESKVTVNDASAFLIGDQVVIIQMQGAQIDESNSASFGDVNTINGAGLYEINEIDSIIGNDVYLKYQLENTYEVLGKVQLIRMPVYDNAEVVDTLTANAWDGNTGGVLAFQVDGQLLMNEVIDVSGLGFRGGIAQTAASNNCTWLVQQNDFFYELSNWRGSAKGEGIAAYILNKEAGKGSQANGGGGGNDHNAGGGGGANITSAGKGGDNDEPSTFGCKGFHPGVGGKGISMNSGRLFLGGGGGAGHENNNAATDGGNGGGIVIIKVNEFIPAGFSILANGITPPDGFGDGGGGGGAGGTIVFETQSIASTIHFESNGGDGGLVSNVNAARCFGPGGGGSGGRIITNLTTGDPFMTSQNGGLAGMSVNSTSCADGTNGATDGMEGVLESTNDFIVQASSDFLFPLAGFSFSINGGMVDFLNLSTNANTTNWDFGDTATDNANDPSHTYTQSGTYDVELIVSNDCGADTLVQQITISLATAPSAAFTQDIENGCSPLTVNFTDVSTGTVDTYQWTFNGGTPASSSLQNPAIVYNTPGVYDVELMISGPGGMDVIVLEDAVEVFPDPVANFNFAINGGTVDFLNLSTDANTSNWDFGDTATDNTNDPSHTYSQSGTYDVELIVTNDCGADTLIQQVMVTVQSPLTAAFTLDDGNGCAPWLVSFMDNSIGMVDSYFWTFDGGNPATSTDPNPQVVYNDEGLYDVQLEISGPQGMDVILMEDLIEIAPAVIADFGYNANDAEISFINNSTNATMYEWDFGDGSPLSNDENPVHVFMNPGTYEVTLSASSADCASVIMETIFVDFVDVEDIGADASVKIYPNPGHDFITIETAIDANLPLQLFSLDGKEFPTFRASFNHRKILNISELPASVYLLKLTNEDVVKYFKVSKF